MRRCGLIVLLAILLFSGMSSWGAINLLSPIRRLDLGILLHEVSEQFTYRYSIVSAFPDVLDTVPVEENADLRGVWHFYRDKYYSTYYQHRIEMLYTGGDWMDHGLVYFITDARQQVVVNGRVQTLYLPRVYFVPELSTPDAENGAVAPAIDPFDAAQVSRFIRERFLNLNGWVQPGRVALNLD